MKLIDEVDEAKAAVAAAVEKSKVTPAQRSSLTKLLVNSTNNRHFFADIPRDLLELNCRICQIVA